tara:strand:+ start:1230 stop:1451 length:222 start_codon:yes stop_codon:yes gene_type:complete
MTTPDEHANEDIPFGGREGRVVPGETVILTPEQVAARKRRNLAIALSLVAFVALVFVVTVIRIGQNIAQSAGL